MRRRKEHFMETHPEHSDSKTINKDNLDSDLNVSKYMAWKEKFFETLFPIDKRVISIPYPLKKPSNREYLDKLIPDRKRANVDMAFKLLESHVPNFVYKYRSVSEYSLSNFRDDTIWISYPKDFNDPFDSVTIESELNMEGLNDFAGGVFSQEYMDSVQELFRAAYMESTQVAFTVACLSETNASVLMWSHYANDHKGFCIEYNGREIYYDEFVNKCFFPVKYIGADEEQLPISALALDYPGLYSVLCKTEDWSYEKEWRICFGIERNMKPGNIQLPQATGVYLGAKMPAEHRKMVVDIAVKKNIPVYQEIIQLANRQINFELITD